MKSLILGLLVIFSSPLIHADGGMFIGINNTGYSSSVSGISFDSVMGFEAGFTKIVDFGSAVYLRTGIGVTQRNAKFDIGTAISTELDFIMAEVPVTILFDFGDVVAGFTGINANYVASSSCSSTAGACDDNEAAEDFIMTFVAGLNIAMTYNHVAELYFETSMGELAPNLEYGGLGARYVYMFD